MAGDNLFVVLAMIRAELDIDDETFAKLKRMLADRNGGGRLYVPIERKRQTLAALEAVENDTSNAQVSRLLGVSVRHIQRMKRLRK